VSIFPNLLISAVRAGESSGTLEDNLESVSEQLKKTKTLKSKIKAAMVYPIIVLTAAFILGMAMSFLVLPKITPLFEGLNIDLPATTRFLIWFSHIINSYGQYILIGIIAGAAFFAWLVRQKFSRPVTHFIILKTPLIRAISRNSNLSDFCRVLGTLLKSGLNIDEALNITKNSLQNYYYVKVLEAARQRITRGQKLSEILSDYEKYFPDIAVSMIKVGEKSGRLEETLFYLAEFFEEEVENATKSLATAIEPILLIFIGLVVGGLALSIITPIYQITGNVQR